MQGATFVSRKTPNTIMNHPGSESTEVSPVGRVGEHPRPTSKVPKSELSEREGREISQTARRLA